MKATVLTLGLSVLLLAPLAAGPATAQPSPADNAAGPAVPVSVAKVARQDMPIVIRGLGTVQAHYAVLLRTQVDGRLMQIAVAEGQDVRKGDLLAVIDTRVYQAALDAALARQQQDQALLINAQADLTRYTALASRDFASRQKVEAQQAQVSQITAAIAGDAALIEAARVNLGFCQITAPFDGRVGLRTIDPGNFVRAAEATPILPLAQIRPITVTFTVPQDKLPAIQRAMAAGKPAVAAFASDDTTALDQGTLLTVDNAIDPATGTIKAKAIFPNAATTLWPGQFVNTRLLVGTRTGVLTVPSAAVQHGQDRLYVYVIKDDRTAEARTVTVDHDDGVTAIIAKGLEGGQLVVTDGQSRLRSGIRVAIDARDPNRTGG